VTRLMSNLIRSSCLLAFLLMALVPASAADLIPAGEVATLQKAWMAAQKAKPGSAEQRRACKRVVRSGKSLVDAHPDAANRFELLGLMLQNQKVVVKLEPHDRNREVLYGISRQLAGAPDEWAELKLEADLLLSERDLSGRGASLEERGQALVTLIERYRGTTAEPKSLMIGAVIAQNLDSRELLGYIEQTMDERCPGHPEVIAFRRKVLSLKSLRVKCEGRYRRADGTELYIPGDRIGHQCLLVYWSQESSGIERFIQQVKEQQDRFPGAFEVYSFNLDELPDAGETLLRDRGLDWHAMHLPKGERNLAYQAYGAANPAALFVNAFGYTVLNPFGVNPDAHVGVMSINSGIFKISEARLSHDRYLAQLQSLVIGDFLVWDAPAGASTQLPKDPNTQGFAESLEAIQSCFVPPPLRYRLTREEALANYRRADRLCTEMLRQVQHDRVAGAEAEIAVSSRAGSRDLCLVRNRRIIALLGMWNLACDPAHLEQAVQEAKAVLAAKVSPEDGVVARFCLAKAALRGAGGLAAQAIREMVEESGGDEAPASAVAAAAILALEANSRELHEEYRTRTLALLADGERPMWGVRTFLEDRYHRFYLLRPNTTRGDRMGWTRGHIVNHGWNTNAVPFPSFELKSLDGSALSLPEDTNGRLTLLLFIEPPPESDADYPVVEGKKGFVPKDVFQLRDYLRGVVKTATELADQHVNNEVDVRLAFLTDDAQRVGRLMKTNDWDCAAALVPGGLANPMVQQLGILSADRLPNVFLLRRDGTVAWNCSGLVYKSEFGFPFAVTLAMKVHIEISDIKLAYRALRAGDYQLAARTFAGPFLPALPDRFGWRAPRHHGGALAHMALKDWDGALACIDKAIDSCKLRYYRGRRSRAIEDWRKDAATVTVKEPDDILTELWATKATILDGLGRKDEAATLHRRSQVPAREEHMSIYKEFHEQLKAWRSEYLPKAP
jgi:hypothetical protein